MLGGDAVVICALQPHPALQPLLPRDSEAKASFVQEMSLLKTLTHPNVLKFLGLYNKERNVSATQGVPRMSDRLLPFLIAYVTVFATPSYTSSQSTLIMGR
jgi:serine/threonine protein kinase